MSESIIFLSIMMTSSLGQLQDCLFTDTNSGTLQLDLRPLNELKIDYEDSVYSYSYSICANNLECTPLDGVPVYVMLDQYEPLNNRTDPSECWWLAQWNNENILQPSFNPNSQYWRFPPYQGMPGCAVNVTRQTSILWQCNPSVETAEIIDIYETSPCNYIVIIQSQYACENAPPPYCKWYSESNAILDLNIFENTVITAKDTSIDEYVFVYTPCRNGTLCGDKGNVMSKLENVTNSECASYLSIWDGDNQHNAIPFYDQDNKVWEFEYNSGETCNNQLPSEFFVYWFCNPDVNAPNYNIKVAQNVGPCLYELEIESSVAC